MKDAEQTKERLVHELTELRSGNAALKKTVTGSRAAELAAEEARRYAESLVEAVREPLLVLDADLKIVSANRSFYSTFKVTSGETIGSFIYDLGDKQWDIPTLREQLEDVLLEKQAFDDFEVDQDFQNIGHKTLLLNARQIQRKDTGAKTILLAMEDITGQRMTAEKLMKSESDVRLLIAKNVDGLIIVDVDGILRFMNPAAELLFGRTAEKLMGNHLGLPLASGEAEEMDLSAKDGTQHTVEMRSAAITWEKKEAFLISLRDITDRKRSEADRERLTVAIEQAAEIVMVTDAEGTIQYVNPIFETVTGYTRAEAVGQNPRLLKSGGQDEVFYRGLWETIAAGRVWFGRLVNRRKDGSLYTEDTTISPVHDEAGRIVSYVAVKRNITEELRLAEEKATLEDQLRQAQKVEAIGRLAGGVAHDFNNMMAIILGYGEMLLGQLRLEDPARNWAEQIMEAGRRSASLTRQLLAFSRKQSLLPEVLDLNALLRNFEKMFGRLIGENVELEFKLAAGLGRTKADPGQIEQVITNLVLNARDAMPMGGKLTVETANVELDPMYALGHQSVLPGSYVMLAVSDTGRGMDKATMARLFEPFFTTKEKGKGTGLGLATAYGIVKQSGGYIWAYSEPEHGTTFKIYLPQTDAALAADVVEAGGVAPRGSGERILLVEDEASLRDLCETVLVRLGYQVNAAGNGLKAVLLVQELGLEPDLVITDVIMPVMSGAEMTERLRRDRPDLRVLYMSGYPDDTIARHGILEPGTPFLQKPFTEKALALKVREALGVKPAATRPGRSVLMIDDDEQYRELMQHFCTRRGHLFAGADSSAAALAHLAGHPFDVLLVDMNIPGTSGACVLREIRAAGHAAPAIVLTGDVASVDMDVLRPLGVAQALEKSSNAEPLLQAIEAAGTAGG